MIILFLFFSDIDRRHQIHYGLRDGERNARGPSLSTKQQRPIESLGADCEIRRRDGTDSQYW